MYVELHAYQHHVFMDWRFVDDSNWRLVNSALNGAGVESMSAKWEEIFGKKDEAGRMNNKEVKVRKVRKKALVKKGVKEPKKKTSAKMSIAPKAVQKTAGRKTSAKPKKPAAKENAQVKKTKTQKPVRSK